MVYLIAFIFFVVISQVLLKQASIMNKRYGTGAYLLRMIKTSKVITAYGFSALSIITWIIALSKNSLMEAVFFTGSIYVIMVVVDHFFFNERMNLMKIVG